MISRARSVTDSLTVLPSDLPVCLLAARQCCSQPAVSVRYAPYNTAYRLMCRLILGSLAEWSLLALAIVSTAAPFHAVFVWHCVGGSISIDQK